MIRIYLTQISLLIKRLLICYLSYFITRLLFVLANKTYFSSLGVFDFLTLSVAGLRFDTFSIMASNSLFILLSLLPVNWFVKKWYQTVLLWIFVVTNSLFLMANCIDLAYFRFTKKRSNADLFEQLGGQSDLGKLLPQFLIDFWWVFIIYMLLIYILIYLFKKTKVNFAAAYHFKQTKHWILIFLLFIVSVAFTILGIRGGLQRVPIDMIDAGSMASPGHVPIVLNTPFTLIKSTSQHSLKEYSFFTDTELKKQFDPIHQFSDSSFIRKNVVVIILESFSKEYTKLGGQKSLTPFLDSLMDHSLTFTNAFSNSNKSIEGIPAILASMPSLMENPLINSNYANNAQSSLALLLKKEGYSSAFFHGGINGTMNFDDWAVLAGYDSYYGRNEYNNEADFDGFWGIWDEPFLNYAAKTMSSFKEPFHSAIFTLSSHHPFFVPQQFKNKFPRNGLENAESIGYADYALRQFFKEAQKASWYKNTLFILTADHCSLSEHPFYKNTVGNLCIPILFYQPNNALAEKNNEVFSQMDILPTALEMLHYPYPFFAFGKNYTDTHNRYSYYYSNSSYHLISDSMDFQFNKDALTYVFNYKRDSTLWQNLITKYPVLEDQATNSYKAFVQSYNHTLIHNTGGLK